MLKSFIHKSNISNILKNNIFNKKYYYVDPKYSDNYSPIVKKDWKQIYKKIFFRSSIIFTPIIYIIEFDKKYKSLPVTTLLNSALVGICCGALWPITVPYSISLFSDIIYLIFIKR